MVLSVTKINEIMKKKGIKSKKDFALILGISKTQLSNIFSNDYDILKSNIRNICDILEVDISEITELKKEKIIKNVKIKAEKKRKNINNYCEIKDWTQQKAKRKN